MSDITKGYTFNDNEQVTADKLNNLVDNATIANDAVTTDKVQDGAITRDKLAEDAMGIKSVQRFNGDIETSGIQSVIIDLNTDGNTVDFSKTSVSGFFTNAATGTFGVAWQGLSVNESTQEITLTIEIGADATITGSYYIEVLEFY